MASSDLTGSSILDDFSAEDRLAGEAEVSHGSLLDDEREADMGLEVQADNGISGDTSGGDDAVRKIPISLALQTGGGSKYKFYSPKLSGLLV